jgi:hypothetical protein
MQDPQVAASKDTKPVNYANPEMLDRISKLEDGMLGKDSKKLW